MLTEDWQVLGHAPWKAHPFSCMAGKKECSMTLKISTSLRTSQWPSSVLNLLISGVPSSTSRSLLLARTLPTIVFWCSSFRSSWFLRLAFYCCLAYGAGMPCMGLRHTRTRSFSEGLTIIPMSIPHLWEGGNNTSYSHKKLLIQLLNFYDGTRNTINT